VLQLYFSMNKQDEFCGSLSKWNLFDEVGKWFLHICFFSLNSIYVELNCKKIMGLL
jgi:hypothetical protein